MKVISGSLKGRTIEGYDLDGTRPTMDRVKESLFAMIQGHVKDAICLDLFAGSGNLGIEALSNGCKKVFFIDRSKEAIRTIAKNIETFSLSSRASMERKDYVEALKDFTKIKQKFNLVFLDPPYQEEYIPIAFSRLEQGNLLEKGALVVCEVSNLAFLPTETSLIRYKERKYGDKYVVIYKKEDA